MVNIDHDVFIKAAIEPVFAAVLIPAGLNAWWTLWSTGQVSAGHQYELGCRGLQMASNGDRLLSA